MPYADPVAQAAAQHRSYVKHKKRIVNRNAKFRLDRQHHICAYLRAHPCVDCGERDPVVLDFDHVRGVKICNVSEMPKRRYSLDKIDAEIAKCDVRCANCHRRRHYHDNGCTHRDIVKSQVSPAFGFDIVPA